MIYLSNNEIDLFHSIGIPYNVIYNSRGKLSSFCSLLLIMYGVSLAIAICRLYIYMKKK